MSKELTIKKDRTFTEVEVFKLVNVIEHPIRRPKQAKRRKKNLRWKKETSYLQSGVRNSGGGENSGIYTEFYNWIRVDSRYLLALYNGDPRPFHVVKTSHDLTFPSSLRVL